MDKNTLYYGDNLDILRRYLDDESVDLIYLDPPFNSNADYNVLFAEKSGEQAHAQIKAFEDTWEWGLEAAQEYAEVLRSGHDRVAKALKGMHDFLGGNDMMAYLSMMAPRLIELRRVLKPTGSIYLHCHPTASHYLKMLMDAIFGPKHFKNEVIWHYRKWATGWNYFQRNHDVVFFYGKLQKGTVFNRLFMERAPSTLKRFGKLKIVSGFDEHGVRLPSQTEDKESEGVAMDDVWDIGRVLPINQLYATEKPPALLARIITASSPENGLVLDPFCGCGTTIEMAEALKRRWIGIDITPLAITLIRYRLREAFGSTVKYEVIGEPVSIPDAATLAATDPYHFQWWALGLVRARPVEQKKGADKGIDGRLFFHDEPN